MTATARLLDRPVSGSSLAPAMTASARPVRAGRMDFSATDTAPYWARQFARRFLGNCDAITADTAESAVLLVSELVTNAYEATAPDVIRDLPYSQRLVAPVITLSLRHFPAVLLIEVIDSSPDMPHLENSGPDDEGGRGLFVTQELSLDWGYFPVHRIGKCVYAILPAGAAP